LSLQKKKIYIYIDVFLLFVVLTFLGESFAGSGLLMLPLVEEASLVEAFVDTYTKNVENR
jgi:hypothetical protein